MKITGRLIDLYERSYTFENTPFVTVTLLLEVDQDVKSHKKQQTFNFPKPIAIEYTITDYRRKGQDHNIDDFYLRLMEMHEEAKKHENYMLEVDFWIMTKDKKWGDGKGHITTLKLNEAKPLVKTIDHQVGGDDYTDEKIISDMGAFPLQGGNDDIDQLPF